jgi:anti-sigma B factor antagonist
MNSTGISLLTRMLSRFRNRGGEMALINPNETVRKLLIITKLNLIFGVYSNKEEAEAVFKSK